MYCTCITHSTVHVLHTPIDVLYEKSRQVARGERRAHGLEDYSDPLPRAIPNLPDWLETQGGIYTPVLMNSR